MSLKSEETSTSSDVFVEIRKPQAEERPRTVTAFMMSIEPKQCSKIVKQLAQVLPLPESLAHLKRVRNPQKMKKQAESLPNNNDESEKKKPKMMLQVLIGHDKSVSLSSFLSFEPTLEEVTVPGRPPKSDAEWKEFNHIWPTTFLPLRSEEHHEKLLALNPDEIEQMTNIMEEQVRSKMQVVVVDPTDGRVISKSKDEYALQRAVGDIDNNPLATPVLLALQGVSRMERQAASKKSKDEFSKGQYLCTGYDLYAPYEPTIFEAMSCLHHRLRRLVYWDGTENPNTVWRNGLSRHYIHSLPGTNHRYRSFQYFPGSTD
ncbi:unnamed protein product [Cylindrotheca closterium]|uniref:Uncharacterized protein n=1 Tax=Cylindrotheca closterium TaxID=2856 RepID=A0AAD2G415_9STRA|nr:unnamed protein product [Cylindrotheca closterium]